MATKKSTQFAAAAAMPKLGLDAVNNLNSALDEVRAVLDVLGRLDISDGLCDDTLGSLSALCRGRLQDAIESAEVIWNQAVALRRAQEVSHG